jgi:hypothetical protein
MALDPDDLARPYRARAADTVRDRHRLRAGPRALAAFVALAGVAVLVAGCGGGSSPGVASMSSSSASSGRPSASTPTGGGVRPVVAIGIRDKQKALDYAACMRANGVPKFPDPNAQGVLVESQGGVDLNSPQFRKAQQTCSADLNLSVGSPPSPAQRAAEEAAGLAFARCMRSHGVPDFPDPGIRGAIRVSSGSSIDPNSPLYRKAEQTCSSLLFGRPGKAG